MKQLDLFTQTCSIEEIAKTGKKEPIVNVETGFKPVSTTTEPSLTTDKLARYRAKLAKLDATGEYNVIVNGQTMSAFQIIECDTIHRHNRLAQDMRIIASLYRMQWSTEAIGNYFLTRRIKNRRPQ